MSLSTLMSHKYRPEEGMPLAIANIRSTEQDYEVICFLADVGQEEDWEAVRAKAVQIGATKMYVFLASYITIAIEIRYACPRVGCKHLELVFDLSTNKRVIGLSRTSVKSLLRSSASVLFSAMLFTSSATFSAPPWPVPSLLVPRCEVCLCCCDYLLLNSVVDILVVAEQEGCDFVSHGCTGKGNDQVRFEV